MTRRQNRFMNTCLHNSSVRTCRYDDASLLASSGRRMERTNMQPLSASILRASHCVKSGSRCPTNVRASERQPNWRSPSPKGYQAILSGRMVIHCLCSCEAFRIWYIIADASRGKSLSVLRGEGLCSMINASDITRAEKLMSASARRRPQAHRSRTCIGRLRMPMPELRPALPAESGTSNLL